MQEVMKMVKLDIPTLERAYAGEAERTPERPRPGMARAAPRGAALPSSGRLPLATAGPCLSPAPPL